MSLSRLEQERHDNNNGNPHCCDFWSIVHYLLLMQPKKAKQKCRKTSKLSFL